MFTQIRNRAFGVKQEMLDCKNTKKLLKHSHQTPQKSFFKVFTIRHMKVVFFRQHRGRYFSPYKKVRETKSQSDKFL